MNFLDWQKKTWRDRVMLIMTVVLVIVLASHPELRLFLPLLDALGLDLLLLLISVQFLDYARPVALITYRRVFVPLAGALYNAALFFFGMMGPFVDARVATCRQWRNTAT